MTGIDSSPKSVLIVLILFLVAAVADCQETRPSKKPVPPKEGEAQETPPAGAAQPGRQEGEALPQDIETIVITASRRLEREFDVPRSMNIVGLRRIRARAGLSVADSLDRELGLWVEKRTAHTSDPVVRGLSGSNLLALIDGNTLSTFWGEGGFAGDDMYGKIDPELIERIEVIRGPSSVLYGSNALGAVLNFVTRGSPFDFTEEGVRVGGRSRIATSTAPSMWRFHQEFYGAAPTFRWLVGTSYWEAGGTEDGSGQDQRPTGGEGWFVNANTEWKTSDNSTLTVTVQHTENLHVYRYYRPTQDNSNRRTAVAATWQARELDWGMADEVLFRLYVQHKLDRRRWFDAGTGFLTKTGEASVATVQAGSQFTKYLGNHLLVYGIDTQHTYGESPDDEQFTETPVGGSPMKASPDSLWSSVGIYGHDTWAVNDWFSLVMSARLDVFRFDTDVDSQYTPPGGLDPDVDDFTDHEAALVGGIQAILHLGEATNLFAGWSRGFRQFAPKFGVSQHGFGVVVPSQLLDPVTADQFEVGVKHREANFSADAAAYYTRFRDFQNIVRGTFQGLDWYDFNQNSVRDADEDVFVTVGNGKAEVFGVELGASVNLALIDENTFGRCWTLSAGFMWNYGRDETNDIPIRHTHPTRFDFSVRFDDPDPDRGFWAEFAGSVVRHYDRIPPSRLAGDVGYLEDPQVPSSGMRRTWGLPGYAVFDIRAGVNICENATLTVGVENIFDRLYRPAHARWDAPGRNFYVAADFTF